MPKIFYRPLYTSVKTFNEYYLARYAEDFAGQGGPTLFQIASQFGVTNPRDFDQRVLPILRQRLKDPSQQIDLNYRPKNPQAVTAFLQKILGANQQAQPQGQMPTAWDTAGQANPALARGALR